MYGYPNHGYGYGYESTGQGPMITPHSHQGQCCIHGREHASTYQPVSSTRSPSTSRNRHKPGFENDHQGHEGDVHTDLLNRMRSAQWHMWVIGAVVAVVVVTLVVLMVSKASSEVPQKRRQTRYTTLAVADANKNLRQARGVENYERPMPPRTKPRGERRIRNHPSPRKNAPEED